MPMAKPSALISSIHSVLQYSKAFHPIFMDPWALSLSMSLTDLKVLLVFSKYLGSKSAMQSLFSRIEAAIAKISADIKLPSHAFDRVVSNDLRLVSCLAKEVNDECEWQTAASSKHLTLYALVEVAHSLLEHIANFWAMADMYSCQTALRDAVKEVEVQIRFLGDFLLFAKRIGANVPQIQNLLIHVRPCLLDAARVFQINAGDVDWVEGVQSRSPRLDIQVFRSCTQTLLSISTLDQTTDAVLKDFLSSLISLLWHLLRYHLHPCHSDSLGALYECLRHSRFILKQTNNGGCKDQIGVLVRDAGILICSLYHTDVDPLVLSSLLQRFDVVREQVPQESSSKKANASDFADSTTMEEIFDGDVHTEIGVASHQSSCTPQDAGFQDDEVTSILDRLLRGSKQLRLVPISGMAGLGKTTFALKVYSHSSVIYGFQARTWCTISQVFDKRSVLVQLLHQIHPRDYSEMTEDDLANKLRQILKGKRYLILLDDVWNLDVLESLRPSFPDDRTGSRILLTSRFHAIVPHAMHDEQPHFLRLRKENECLKIMEMKLGHKVVGLSTELEKFVKLCKGLPLTTVLVAGLLAVTMHGDWDGIFDRLSSGGISRMEQCEIALELSYKNLPDELKACFIYFGVFPEDEEINAKRLIQLWTAEGFMEKESDLLKKSGNVGQKYLDDLIQRNLVMVVQKRSIGGVKTCRIHDLLHDFCLRKGKQESLFHLLLQRQDELSDFSEPCDLERLSIHSTALHFKESRLFCPLARSILFFTPRRNSKEFQMSDMLFIIQIYKRLRVLDMHLLLRAGVPSEIALLTQLTYLSICCRVNVIPPSIGNLSNLETLFIKLYGTAPISLPDTIWDLQRLKDISITNNLYGSHCPGFSFPVENLENSPNLLRLESISDVEFCCDGSMEQQMRKFPNIRSLKCNSLCLGESSELNNIVVVPEFLTQLEILTLCAETEFHYQFDFGSVENLRKVKLEGFVMSREEIGVLGRMPNLEVLKLIRISFSDCKMDMEEGQFLKLRILVLHHLYDLEMWTASGDEQLPCLEKLVFDRCEELKEIPDDCLENSSTLEEIEVSDCSSTLMSLVRNIEEVQKDFGNLIRVQIPPEHGSGSEGEEESELEEEEERNQRSKKKKNQKKKKKNQSQNRKKKK